jgi:hypothetical protein
LSSVLTRPRRRRRTACARFALALSGLAVLSGCGWLGFAGAPAQPRTVCPATAILRPLAQTAVFAPGAARQPTAVAFYGVLSEVEARCERAGDALRLSLETIIIGERGPAAGAESTVDLYYFVAVVAPDDRILAKRTFPVRIAVPVDARRAGVTDRVQESVGLAGLPPGELRVVLGFQQSPEVVEFYRHFRGR